MSRIVKTITRTKILIADDHAGFRYGLRALLESEPGFMVVGEAENGLGIAKLARELKPAVLMLDLAMPELSGIEVLRELASTQAEVRTIVLTAAIETKQIVEALQLGARGILLKDAVIPLLNKCIEKVMAGDYWVGREAMTNPMEFFINGLKRNTDETTIKDYGNQEGTRNYLCPRCWM